jgi:hypothetical protein
MNGTGSTGHDGSAISRTGDIDSEQSKFPGRLRTVTKSQDEKITNENSSVDNTSKKVGQKLLYIM